MPSKDFTPPGRPSLHLMQWFGIETLYAQMRDKLQVQADKLYEQNSGRFALLTCLRG